MYNLISNFFKSILRFFRKKPLPQPLSLELQYGESLRKVMATGVRSKNRTGIDTLAIQHQYFYIKDVYKNFPILKGKKLFPKLALKELAWMMNGKTDGKWLLNRGVKYWEEWMNVEGTIGKSYGYQFRNFNGTDPLQLLINDISSNPTSRRLILNLWNHSDLRKMTLPPCVMNYHYCCVPINNSEHNFYLDLHVTQRSADSFLGVPYDFMFVGWFSVIIAKIAEKLSGNMYYFTARDIHYTCDDFHIYSNHFEQVEKYLKNVEENKNGVIDGISRAQIEIDKFSSLDDLLNQMDAEEYKNCHLTKFYEDQYGKIEAPIAI